MTRVVHCKRSLYDEYVGRPSPWGNPFSHKDGTLAKFKVASQQEAVDRYEEWVTTGDDPKAAWVRANVNRLKGKVLGCWCVWPNPEAPCHARVLARMAEALDG